MFMLVEHFGLTQGLPHLFYSSISQITLTYKGRVMLAYLTYVETEVQKVLWFAQSPQVSWLESPD